MESLPLPAYTTTPQDRSNRILQLALFIDVGGVDIVVTGSGDAGGQRHLSRLQSAAGMVSSRRAVLSVFCWALGFRSCKRSRWTRSTREVLGLPKRATSAKEWALGAAIGWGVVVLAVLPMTLAGTLHVRFWTEPRAFELAILNLVTLAVAALAEEVAFRGYPYRRLIRAIGPVTATIVMAVLFGPASPAESRARPGSASLITMLAGRAAFDCVAAHAWVVAGVGTALCLECEHGRSVRAAGQRHHQLFYCSADAGDGTDLADRRRLWAGGGALYRAGARGGHRRSGSGTRDYAWHYTHPPTIPGGYPMEAPAAGRFTPRWSSRPGLRRWFRFCPSHPRRRLGWRRAEGVT